MKTKTFLIEILPTREVVYVKIPENLVKKGYIGPIDKAVGKDWRMVAWDLGDIRTVIIK